MIDDGARELIEQQGAEISKLKSLILSVVEDGMDTQGAIDELFGWQQGFRVANYVDTKNPFDIFETPEGNVIIDASGIDFSGTVYLSGNKYDGLNSDATLPWIKVSIAAGTVSEEAGPPSNPFPQNEEWYEKANISGDIHVPVF